MKTADVQINQVSQGWKHVKLGDALEVIRGASPRPKGDPRYFGGKIPWIMIADVTREKGKYLSGTRQHVTEEGAKKSRYLKAGTLILSNSATVCVPKILQVDGCIHDGFVAFPNLPQDIDIYYLYYFFEYIRPQIINENRQGITQVNLNTTIVKNIDLILAPPYEQKRIVAEIEKQFSRMDEAVANLNRVKANLKRYKAAVLKAAVEGKLTAVNGHASWKHQPIDVAIESLDQGWSPRCENEPSNSPEVWGVIKTTAVQALRFLEIENKRLPAKLKPRRHLELSAGDLLITRAGPRTRVGVACLVKATRPRLINCDKVYRLRAKSDMAIPAYLELVLNAPHIVNELDELKTGISDSGLNLTQKRFRDLIIPFPPLAEQKRIVSEVERHLSIISEVELEVDTNLNRAERMRQSVLRNAFLGKS